MNILSNGKSPSAYEQNNLNFQKGQVCVCIK